MLACQLLTLIDYSLASFIILYQGYMDLKQVHTLSPQYFFEESTYENRLLLHPIQLEDSILWKDILNQNVEEGIHDEQKLDQLMLVDNNSDLSFLQFAEIKIEIDYSDQFSGFLDYHIQNIHENIYESIEKPLEEDYQDGQQEIQLETIVYSSQDDSKIQVEQLEKIIGFLVQYSNLPLPDIKENISILFPQSSRKQLVKTLIQKFLKLKKTKQQLVKYCMRKAFKFILQLPKNTYILNNQKQEKYSYSKCKNKYLKNISEEKSMNNTFLKQVFSEKDFAVDYKIFLYEFEEIMINDNQKKIKNLASLLHQYKQGKHKKAELVKRLPWTKNILQKVLKISQDLLKFAQG